MKKSKKRKLRNRNVDLSYIFTAFQSFGRGIWMGNILSLYIVILAEQSEKIFGLAPNELLGITAGVTGISMTAVVLPSGFLVDKFSRDKLLKVAAIVGLGAMIAVALADSIHLIFLGLLLWGLFQGISRPAFESILADSLYTGRRSGTYSKLHLVRQLGMAAGPFLNIILFLIIGDKWELNILKTVMLTGVLFSGLSTITLFLFKDENSLGEESESLTKNDKEEEMDEEEKKIKRDLKKVPFFLITSNIIIGFGAGMTVKFFPVFFRAIYELKPINVQFILGFTAIFTGLFAILAQKLSLKRGRAKIILLVQFIATVCLFVIAFYPPLGLLIPIFIARGSLMNSANPLSRSILMDVISKNNRGKWNSLQTIAWGLFWNVSAVLGGFLIGDNNFRFCFLITGFVYLIGTIPIIYIIPIMKKSIDKHNF